MLFSDTLFLSFVAITIHVLLKIFVPVWLYLFISDKNCWALGYYVENGKSDSDKVVFMVK